MAMQRDIGLVGLTFVAVGGVLGSGWLFAPLMTSQLAGPAALIAWVIGGSAMLLLALTFAEISTLFPVAGGIARIPQFSHGKLLAMLMGWSAWAGYCTTAPIEVEAALRYAATYVPGLHDGTTGGLTTPGMVAAGALLLIFTLINAFGVQWFTRINTTMTWFKLLVPVVVVCVIFANRFDPANFTQHDGFMPYGISGIFAAVSSGGVVFAFVGFRHAIDMAGEAQNPQRNIPLALFLSVVICLAIYGALQFVFTGAVNAADFAGGWSTLHFSSTLGPLDALATALGILWLVSLLNVAAVISPMGGGLVSVGSNGRLAMAMANNGVFPDLIARLNRFGVPLQALVLNYIVAVVMLATMPFQEILALNGAAIVLSFTAGPIAVVSLRSLAAGYDRAFRLPVASMLAPLGFVIATLMVFWSGWETTWRLLLLLAVGLGLFLARLAVIGKEDLNPRGAIWFIPYIGMLGVVSWLGSYGTGRGAIPAPYDSLAVAALSCGLFFFAVRCRLPQADFDAFIEGERQLEKREYGSL